MDQTTPQKTSTGGIDIERVRASIGPVLSARGVALVAAEWVTDRSGWILRLTIEHEGSTEDSGGVTLEDCVDISRGVSEVLDAEDFIGPAYNLEVSSPGLDRPLRTEAEFARFNGRLARVKLSQPAPDGQRLLRGALQEAPAGRVAVLVDGKRIEVPFGDIADANLVFELVPQAKKGARAPGGKHAKSEKNDKGGKRAVAGKTGLSAGKSS